MSHQLNDPFVDAKEVVYKFLKNPLDGSRNMVVDGSSTPVSFRYTAPQATRVVLSRINIIILDASIGTSNFGGLAAPLTTGVAFFIKDVNDNLLVDLCDGFPVQENWEFAALAGADWTIAPATDALTIRWTFEKSGKRIILEPGEYFEMLIQDAMAGLVAMDAMVQGYQYPLTV
ncbi:MAG: hypothetical protein V3T10_02900 [Candidatus Bathyarchaeia archaeon]